MSFAWDDVEGTKNILLVSVATKFNPCSVATKPFKANVVPLESCESLAANMAHNWSWWWSTSSIILCAEIEVELELKLVPFSLLVKHDDNEGDGNDDVAIDVMGVVSNEDVVADTDDDEMGIADAKDVCACSWTLFIAAAKVWDGTDESGSCDDVSDICWSSCWVLSKLKEICVISLLLLSNWDL